MAKGKKTGGRDIQKGQVLNPNGRRLPADIKELRAHNKFEVERCLTKYMHMSVRELNELKEDMSLTGLELASVRLVLKGSVGADYRIMDFLFNRTIGKVKEQIEINDSPEEKAIIVLPSNGRESGD